MATVKLPARPRTAMGKQGAKHTREDGQIPAVVYGEQEETLSLQIDATELRAAIATPSGRNVIVQLGVDGVDVTPAVIRDMARHPITREILHIDFMRISENKPIQIRVPVLLTGESAAVKEGRGILDHAMREVEIRCLPRHIPMNIQVDVSELDVGGAVHVSELVHENVEFLDTPGRPVVDILLPTIFLADDEDDAEGAEGEVAEGDDADGEGAAGESDAGESKDAS